MKLAIIGTGMIVKEGALPALKFVDDIEITSICARPHSKDKADLFAAEYAIPKVYTDYDELLANDDADFVYIGLINSVHFDYTKRALLAGKNVIVEKPFATNVAEVEEIADIACKKNLYVFEAVTTLHLPNFAAIRRSLKTLGKIRAVTANYSQYSSRYDRFLRGEVAPAFDPKASGGALLDINIYNINLIVGLFDEPTRVSYFVNRGFNGIDTSGVVVMQYPDFVATALGAKDSSSPSFTLIQGEKGWLRVLSAPNVLKSFEVHVGDQVNIIELNRYEHRMVHEFQEFATTFAVKNHARMLEGLNVSLSVMRTVDRALKSIG